MFKDLEEFSWTFAQLGDFVEPAPKTGQVRKVLRSHFFNKNNEGHWIRINNAREHMCHQSTPSQPYWHLSVLPLLCELLEAEYKVKCSVVRMNTTCAASWKEKLKSLGVLENEN